MKGLVFTEFVEMIEEAFGLEVVDKIIQKAKLPSGGVYTAVGTYDHAEIATLVTLLAEEVEMSVPELLKVFGEHLFSQLARLHPDLIKGADNAFDVLIGVDDAVHVEVLKLYPDAQLPKFDVSRVDEKTISMVYSSKRHLEDLAEGLIRGCCNFFKDEIVISRKTLEDGSTDFHVTLVA